MEQRATMFRRGLELREEQEKRIIRGYAVVFDEVTDRAGYYKEKFDRNSFDSADMSETVLIVGHDFNNLLARNNVNLRIEIDDTGVFYEAELGDTEYDKLIYDRVKRDILDGMSIGFTIADGGIKTDYETKTDTIIKVDKVYEITLTPIPAYPQTVATAVERDVEHEKELREAQEAEEAKKKAEAEKAEAEKIFKELEEL